MERRLTTLMGRMSPYLRQAARTPDSGHDKRFTICVTKASRDTARVRAEARCNQGDPREDGQGLARARVWVRCHQREPRDGRIEKKKKERERETGEPRHPTFLTETHADAGTPRNGQRLLRNFCISKLAARGVVPRPTRQEQRTAVELPGAPGCEHRTTGRGSALLHYARAWCQLIPRRQA